MMKPISIYIAIMLIAGLLMVSNTGESNLSAIEVPEGLSEGYTERIDDIIGRAESGEITAEQMWVEIQNIQSLASRHEIPPWEWQSPPTTVIEQGSGMEAASYIVFTDDSGNYYAKSGDNGEIYFSGTDAATVINNAIDEADSSMVVIKEGLFEITDNIDIERDNFTLIISAGAHLKLTDEEKYIIGIGDHTRTTKYNNITVINYGVLDADKSTLSAPVGDFSQCVNGAYVDNAKLLNYGVMRESNRTIVRFEYCDFVEIRAGSISGAEVSGIDGFGDGPFYVHDGTIDNCGQDGSAAFISFHAPNSVFERLILRSFPGTTGAGMVIGSYRSGENDWAHNNTIRNVVIEQPSDIGIQTHADNSTGTWAGFAKNLKIEGCRIMMPSTTVDRAIMNFRDCDGLIVRDCVLENSGIYSQSQVWVMNTRIENSKLDGVLATDANSIVAYCDISGTDNASYAGIHLSGNYSWALFNNITDGENVGIYVEGLHPNYVIGNFLSGNGGDAVLGLASTDIYYGNYGYATEGSGTATITAGNTSIVAAHGLATTPTVVNITPTENIDTRSYWWTANTENITINMSASHGSNRGFSWYAEV